MRPIDADRLKNTLELRHEQCEGQYGSLQGAVSGFLKLLEAQLTIDAEPVRHGKLISTGTCSLHCEIGECVVCKGLNIVGAKYCQWCGAKLDGESEVQE